MSDRYTRLFAAISAMTSACEMRRAVFTSETLDPEMKDASLLAAHIEFNEKFSDIFECLLQDFSDMPKNLEMARVAVGKMLRVRTPPDISIENLRAKDDHMVVLMVARNIILNFALTYNIRNPHSSQFFERYTDLIVSGTRAYSED